MVIPKVNPQSGLTLRDASHLWNPMTSQSIIFSMGRKSRTWDLRPIGGDDGIRSQRELRALVAVGSNSPPDCYSLPPLFESVKFDQICAASLLSLGGDDGIRTHDPLLAGQVLSQLSYTPKINWFVVFFTFFSFNEGSFALPSLMSASDYLPVQSPVKYFRHCRA